MQKAALLWLSNVLSNAYATMKLIAAWPDYGRNRIITVTETGEIIMRPFPETNPWSDSEQWIRKLASFLTEYEYDHLESAEEVYRKITARYLTLRNKAMINASQISQN